MIIPTNRKQSRGSKIHERWGWVKKTLYSTVIFVLGALFFHVGSLKKPYQSAKLQAIGITKRMIAKYQANPKRIIIQIKFKNFQKLRYKRQEAIASHILISSADDFVPAEIEYDDKVYKIKMRLKGDWTNHLEDDKWSFRIKVKGENTILGMKQFSIQHPKTRNFVNEWFYQQALKREGVLSLRYDFVQVILNGKDFGIYALEEHFEKRLVEHNRYREGPVLKFNEDILWADRKHYLNPENPTYPTGLESEFSSDITAFKLTKTLENPALLEQFKTAHNLLEAFRNQKIATHKVFDVQKLANYLAVSELLGALHGAGVWHNMRFYYNPVTSLLEPIGFDGNAGRQISGILGAKHDDSNKDEFYSQFHSIAFSDTVFLKEYVKTLGRISEPAFLQELLADTNSELQEKLKIIHSEFPFEKLATTNFLRNREIIDKALNPVKALHAYFHEAKGNEIVLELGNIQSMPIEILQVLHLDKSPLRLKSKTLLTGKDPGKPIDYRNVRFAVPTDMGWSNEMVKQLKITYRIFGTDRQREESVFEWPHLSTDFLKNDFIRLPVNAHEFRFLRFDENSEKIYVEPGNWTVDRDLTIPKNHLLVCPEGVSLDLINGATILSYSPVHFFGSQEYPIKIHSSDSTGQGLVVLNAKETSLLEYVIFDNLSSPSKSGWNLTGAVTFYESPVRIRGCQFIGNRSEDGLNIIRSHFVMNNSIFKNTFADAFDGDFVTGEMNNCSFIDCGNDGIDVSGSIVELNNIFMNGLFDKGISIGENSKATLNNIEIENTEIAVASKDMSEITIDQIAISRSRIGFLVFQKKPEFAGAMISVINSTLSNIETPFLVEENSLLTIDGKSVETNPYILEIMHGTW